MKKFAFPNITHISQVKPFIENSKEFAITAKDAFTYVCYKRVMLDTFPPIPAEKDADSQEFLNAIIRLECRGLVFDNRTGELKSRSFQKFFNVAEREDSKLELVEAIFKQALDANEPFYILEKLDGSMCTPILEPVRYYQHPTLSDKLVVVKRLRFRTKMGFDNVTSQAIELLVYGHTDDNKYPLILDEEPALAAQDEFLAPKSAEQNSSASCLLNNLNILPASEIPNASTMQEFAHPQQLQPVIDFCTRWLLAGYNPIFEFFSPDHKIVIDYGKPFVQLLALRHVTSGKYVDFEEMKQDAIKIGVNVVNEWVEEKKVKNIIELMSLVKAKKGQEGCVIRFKDGRMFKIKSKWYSDLHRCKSHLKWNGVKESHVWNLVLDDKIDDTIPTLDTDLEKQKVREFNDKLLKAIEKQVENVSKIIQNAKQTCNNQKEFAKFVLSTYANSPSLFQKILFRCFAGDDIEKTLIDNIKMTLKKGPCDEPRQILGDDTVKFEKLEQVDYLEYVKEKKAKQELLRVKQNKAFDEENDNADDTEQDDDDNFDQ